MWRLGSRLDGKTVVIVGAAGNLGPVWVRSVLSEGARVIACGLGTQSDSALAELGTTHPEKLSLIDLDIAGLNTSGFEEFVSQLAGGQIDGLVLNAGIDSVPGTGKSALSDFSFDDWQGLFDVNVFGVVSFLNKAMPYLANPSSVVTLGSMYGVVSPKADLYSHFSDGAGSMKNPAYGASKAALLAVTKQYGTYLAPAGVRVNMLTLGGVAAGQDAEFVSKFENHVPQGRMVPREELPGALLFLLSDDSLSMTGHNLVVDGGYTTW
jgi:NAD(P)-dependent dehydrogenase (short-subunit alcohol dehydrogenase family)